MAPKGQALGAIKCAMLSENCKYFASSQSHLDFAPN